MANELVKTLEELEKSRKEIAKNCYPAFDELAQYALERRHLDLEEFRYIYIQEQKEAFTDIYQDYLKRNVRLLRIDEICFDRDEKFHLPGVENAITSMRNRGYSLIFIVQSNGIKTEVYLGLAATFSNNEFINNATEAYLTAWNANFPGSKLYQMSNNEIKDVAYNLADCSEFGVLSGIPSLKRKEDTNSFVQGLERLIRAMRGKIYTWISIADPISNDEIREALDNCRNFESEIHSLVKKNLSKATSNGKTISLGLFGTYGQGTSDSTSHTDQNSTTDGTSDTITNSTGETSGGSSSTSETKGTNESFSTSSSITDTHTDGKSSSNSVSVGVGTSYSNSTSASGNFSIFGIGGSASNSSTFGVSTNTSYEHGWGTNSSDAHSIGRTTGQTTGSSFSSTTSHATNWATTTTKAVAHAVLTNLTRGVADSVIRGISSQIAGGFTGSAGMNWTKTTTVGEELLNRRAEAVEESLKAYENRLMEGMAVGMWNLGHYFCASNPSTFDQGCGIVTSLFSGMDSKYEPPRVIHLPQELRNILRCFKNMQLRFSGRPISPENFKDGNVKFVNHPLGNLFNGPTTPVNTKELAIATPIAKQDVEGVTVTERADFGINLGRNIEEKTISIGNILDKGNETRLKYRLNLRNLQKHLAVFGLTGSGKTNTVHSLLMQLWKHHHIPFMVIEPAKAEYRALAEMDELKDDLLVISAGINRTEVCPLRLNPFDFDPGSDKDVSRIHVLTHIDRLKATFNASFPMYASMPYILEEAILEVYRERGWDLGQSQNRYVDIYSQDFSEYLPSLHDLYLKIDSIVERKGYYQEQRMNIQAALKARLSSLMVGAKGSMFNCSRSIPSKDLFNRPVIVELENMGDDDEKSFLMGLLISRLYEYRKATFNKTDENKDYPCHVLVVEEAHRLLQNIPEAAENMETASVKGKAVSFFVDMLSEIRAMRQSVIIVDQLPSRVNTNIVKGTGSKIVHRLLAKDDRESVGYTIGLNDNQIKDISLFRTGEAVINQDGERKAYMVKVAKNDLHEKRIGGEVSKATTDFKEKWNYIFNSVPFDVDLEDWLFKDELQKTMLYGIFEYSITEKLNKIKPSNLYTNWEYKDVWYDIYWKQICDEIWNYYSGSYGLFIKFRRAGSQILKDFVEDSTKINYETICNYQKSGKEYFNNTKSKIVYLNTVGIVYEQFFLRNRIIASINKSLSRTADYNSFEKDLIVSIANVLPLVMPNNKADGTTELEKTVVKEILHRISNRLRDGIDNEIIALLKERSNHD